MDDEESSFSDENDFEVEINIKIISSVYWDIDVALCEIKKMIMLGEQGEAIASGYMESKVEFEFTEGEEKVFFETKEAWVVERIPVSPDCSCPEVIYDGVDGMGIMLFPSKELADQFIAKSPMPESFTRYVSSPDEQLKKEIDKYGGIFALYDKNNKGRFERCAHKVFICSDGKVINSMGFSDGLDEAVTSLFQNDDCKIDPKLCVNIWRDYAKSCYESDDFKIFQPESK